MQVSMAKIAATLRRNLRKYNITPEFLQQRTGLSTRTIGRIYTGKRDDDTPFVPSLKTLAKAQRVVDSEISKI